MATFNARLELQRAPATAALPQAPRARLIARRPASAVQPWVARARTARGPAPARSEAEPETGRESTLELLEAMGLGESRLMEQLIENYDRLVVEGPEGQTYVVLDEALKLLTEGGKFAFTNDEVAEAFYTTESMSLGARVQALDAHLDQVQADSDTRLGQLRQEVLDAQAAQRKRYVQDMGMIVSAVESWHTAHKGSLEELLEFASRALETKASSAHWQEMRDKISAKLSEADEDNAFIAQLRALLEASEEKLPDE